jgi:hypothetical protein
MELSSTFSTNLWNKSQSAAESEVCGVGFARAVRSRVLRTRVCRGKIIVAGVYVGWADGRSGRSSECVTAIDGQRVYGGRPKSFKRGKVFQMPPAGYNNGQPQLGRVRHEESEPARGVRSGHVG